MLLDLRAGPSRAVPAVALVSVCAVAGLATTADDEGPVLCPYRVATGGWCPGCGCTRALGSLVRLDPSAAFQLNPFVFAVLAQALVLVGWITAAPDRALAWWGRHDIHVLQANLGLGLAIWATRLAAGSIPPPF